MKIKAPKEDLVRALSNVQSVVEKKGPPILSHVLIEAEKGEVKFTATDFDLTIKVISKADVIDPGKATAPARSLFDIVKEFPESSVELVCESPERINIVAEKAFFQLPSLDYHDFPVDQLEEDVIYTPCNAKTLERILTKTFYAIPTTSSTLSSPGLYVSHRGDNVYRFISFDAFRLSCMEIPEEELGTRAFQGEILIPRKGVQELMKIIEETEMEEIYIGTNENVFYAKGDFIMVSMRLMESAFPSFDAIIPKERPNVAAIPLAPFKQALKRMTIFTDQSWRHVKLVFNENTLEISAGNAEIGIGREELAISYAGPPLEIAFNIRYLSEAISVVSSETFNFEWAPGFEGGFVTDPGDPAYLALIMPVVSD